MDNELKVTSGTTATISYDCVFVDGEKKTVTIGSYRTQDVPTNLARNINNFNEGQGKPENFDTTFISPKTGANFNKINGATITVTNRNVLI